MPEEENLIPAWEEQPPIPTQEQIAEELRTEPRFQNYFKNYQAASVESFIQHYALMKSMWLSNAEDYLERSAGAESLWMEEAAGHLKQILQKKLFDAQCLWRAEGATYEGVAICMDFRRWERDILNCPFLEPITEEDLELYRQFLLSNNGEPRVNKEERWQDYEEIKEAYATDNANQNFPEWYDFHNGRTGAGALMNLPDIRGPKEAHYLALCEDARNAEYAREEAEQESAPTYDQRPVLPYGEEDFMRYFLTTFEDARLLAVYEAQKYTTRNFDEGIYLNIAIQFMLDAGEPIPIKEHYDFREAIWEAERSYRLRKVLEHLPLAYEEYRMNLSLGLHVDNDEVYEVKVGREWARCFRRDILEGRRLAGEPEDFNF